MEETSRWPRGAAVTNFLKIAIVILVFVIVMRLIMMQAHSSPACMTLGEARTAYPGKHLWWHGQGHCWNAEPGRKIKPAAKKLDRKPIRGDDPNGNKAQEIQPQPHETTLWPFLIVNAAAIDPQWFSSEHSTEWPRLLDVDELTSDAAPPDCCWPALEQQVAFNDRWQEVPHDWPQSNAKPEEESLWTIPVH